MKHILKKILLYSALAIGCGLLLAPLLLHPVQRTILRIPASGEFGRQQLVHQIQALEGVFGIHFESGTGTLLVDHCPELESVQLAQQLSSFGAVALESKRILPLNTLSFPVRVADSATGRTCEQPASCCPASAAWKKLLARGVAPERVR